jgi:hypothetical protein
MTSPRLGKRRRGCFELAPPLALSSGVILPITQPCDLGGGHARSIFWPDPRPMTSPTRKRRAPGPTEAPARPTSERVTRAKVAAVPEVMPRGRPTVYDDVEEQALRGQIAHGAVAELMARKQRRGELPPDVGGQAAYDIEIVITEMSLEDHRWLHAEQQRRFDEAGLGHASGAVGKRPKRTQL